MKRLPQLSLAILSLALTTCANQPQNEKHGSEWQLATINLWHQCVDNNLQFTRYRDANGNPNDIIQHTLIACQGYREDVLATFPSRLEPALDQLMVEQTYEAGYTLFAAENGIPLPITSVTYDTLRAQQ